MALLIAVILCVASSVAYAGAAVQQRRLAHHPVSALGRQPGWWPSLALNGVGALLHVGALRFGSLLLVQPLGLLTIMLAVSAVALEERRRVTRPEWSGMVLTGAGLLALVLTVGTPGARSLPGPGVPVLIVVALLVLVALHLAGRRPGASTLWPATAAGIGFAVASALTQTAAVDLSPANGPIAWRTVAVAVAGVAVLATASMLLTQVSYRRRFGAAVATSTLVNPVASAAVGVIMLGEGLRGGAVGIIIGIVGAYAAARGIMILSARPEPALAH